MNLYVFINCRDNSIIKMIPSDEEIKLPPGDSVKLDEDSYLILSKEVHEFNEYELIVTVVTVNYFKEDENELH